MIYLDAGTTYSKIISDEKLFEDEICEKDGKALFHTAFEYYKVQKPYSGTFLRTHGKRKRE